MLHDCLSRMPCKQCGLSEASNGTTSCDAVVLPTWSPERGNSVCRLSKAMLHALLREVKLFRCLSIILFTDSSCISLLYRTCRTARLSNWCQLFWCFINSRRLGGNSAWNCGRFSRQLKRRCAVWSISSTVHHAESSKLGFCIERSWAYTNPKFVQYMHDASFQR